MSGAPDRRPAYLRPNTNNKLFETEKQQVALSILAAGAKVNASYTLNVLRGTGPSGIKLGIFAKGDFKGTVDYTSEKATSTPLFQMQGAFSLGFDGRF